MKTYDLIAIGTGSAMTIVQPFISINPKARVAVIDKDPPGGICLTKGCIPTKMLVYPAELVRSIENAEAIGLSIDVKTVDFPRVMDRMRRSIQRDIDGIRKALSSAPNIDYYNRPARFTGEGRLEVGGTSITSKKILLCLGSRPTIPSIKGLEAVDHHTSDTILDITERPNRIAIVGGGYIAAEYAHFFSAMGSKVTIIARNAQFLPEEEPEISFVAEKTMERYATVLTGHEAVAVSRGEADPVKITARRIADGESVSVGSELLLIATGRSHNTDLLSPEAGGIELDESGWIRVDDHFETSRKGVYAFGDAIGRHMFKHVANHEAKIVFFNLVYGEKLRADYHAVPHAVFTYPEIAAVGMGEKAAIEAYGDENIRIGYQRFRDTARGHAMNAGPWFVKVIVEAMKDRIVGAHIVGPQAALLIQEIVTVMTAGPGTADAVSDTMHIHPALSETVEWACASLMTPETYQERFKREILSEFLKPEHPANRF